MLGYFSKSKCQHFPRQPDGFMISKQPNTYIKKTWHFWTASNKVKDWGWLNAGYRYTRGWGKVPSHLHTLSHLLWFVFFFYCCEFHTEWAEPSFVIIGWLSHAVRHWRPVGVQSIVGIAGGRHCFRDYGCKKAPSHTITSFVVCLLFTAVNFIRNKQSPALSSLVDCPMLFGIDGL